MAILNSLFGKDGSTNAGANASNMMGLGQQNTLGLGQHAALGSSVDAGTTIFNGAVIQRLRQQQAAEIAATKPANNFAVEIRSVANGYIIRRVSPDYHGRVTADNETYVFKDLADLPGIVAVMQSKDDMAKD